MADWYEQTRSMMEMWTKAQQQMMQGWMGNSEASADPNMGSMMEMWRKMTMQSMQQWTQHADPAIKSVAEQMLNGQQAMMQMFNMMSQTWQQIMPIVNTGGDWNKALTEQMQKIRAVLLESATDVVGAGSNLSQLWQTYLSQWQNFGMPWMQAMQQGMPLMGSAMMGDQNALTQMTNMYWDAFQDTFGQLLQAPGIGYTREFDEKQRRAFAAWLDYQEASYEYQVVLAETWVKAFDQLMREMVELSQQGQKIEGLRAFINRWSETADHIFKDVFQSDVYVIAQSKLVNALMAYRIKQRDVNEKLFEMMDMPTRSEVDEANRRIYELRKEVKALKKELATLKDKPKSTSRKRNSTKSATVKQTDQEDS